MTEEPKRRPVAKVPDLATPKIPGYKIECELGRGTSGIVYRASQISVDRQVALKVMHLDRSINMRSVRRLQREARIAAHLSHPNLISAIDMGQSGSFWWFAMELVEGPSLAERLEKGGRLKETEALILFSQLCEALQHASEKGVVHRDIKPANILLERPDLPRLADLGLARIEDDPMLTRSGATLGTPHYISPEQARDPGAADARSDIWSLGATMYHSVCGRPPFSGTSTAEILSSVLYSPIPDPIELRPELSRGLALVLRKCLSRNPDKRYFAAAEMRADLALVAAHKAPAIKRGSLEPLDPTKGENRGMLMMATFAGAMALLFVLLVWKPWSADFVEPLETDSRQDLSWRPIERFERTFAAGKMSLASAFAELDGLSEHVSDNHRLALEQARGKVRQRLREELASFWNQAGKELNSLISDREFDLADRLLGPDLSERLVVRTGYAPKDLPIEMERLSFERRLANYERTLKERRESALNGALSSVSVYVRGVLLLDVERKRQAGAWDEARRLLAAGPAALCESANADRRGLDQVELWQGLAPILTEIEERAQELEIAWTDLDSKVLLPAVQRLAEAVGERIRTNSGTRPLEAFDNEFDTLLGRHRIDRECLERAPQQRSLSEYAKSRNLLQDLNDERAQEAGGLALEQLVQEASGFYAQRDYDGAILFWQAHLDDEVLRVLQDTVAVRLEGAQELAAFLLRASMGLERLKGKTVSLRQGSIGVVGKVDLRGDALEYGFRLRETGGSPLVYLLRPSAEVEGTLLGAQAVARFALEGADLEKDIGLQLQLALFYYHEGDFSAASEMLESEALQGGALIYFDLGLRVAKELGEEQGLLKMRRKHGEEELQRLTGVDAEAMDPGLRSLEIARLLRGYRDVLSGSAISLLVQKRRELESSAPPSTLIEFREAFRPSEASFPHYGRVLMRFDLAQREVGTWEMGDWFFGGEGWSSVPCTDLVEFGQRTSPSIRFKDPLLVASGTLEVKLRMRQPEDSAAELLSISAFGFHAIFSGQSGLGPARFLCDTTSLIDVARRARRGEGEVFSGLQQGEEHTITLRLSPGSGRLMASIDGKVVDSGFHRPPKDGGQAGVLSFRSVELLEVREVTIEGDRR